MILEQDLFTYGYPILFLGTILEGETFVIISSALCQTGHLEFVWVVFTAFLGALTGDVICFLTGRCGGARFLRSSAGALVWSITITMVGITCGNIILPFLVEMKYYQFLFIGAIGITGFLIWAIYHKNSD
jgi:membrane protein DedA with SNARE-associated domain